MITALAPIILKNWRILAALVAVLAIVLTLRYIHGQIWQGGYKACESAYAVEAAKLNDQARDTIVRKGKEYEKTIQELISAGDTAGAVGDRTADAIDRLHGRADR